jgi:hypothetical protein
LIRIFNNKYKFVEDISQLIVILLLSNVTGEAVKVDLPVRPLPLNINIS